MCLQLSTCCQDLGSAEQLLPLLPWCTEFLMCSNRHGQHSCLVLQLQHFTDVHIPLRINGFIELNIPKHSLCTLLHTYIHTTSASGTGPTYAVQYLQHFLNVHLYHITTAAVQQSQAHSEHNWQALQKEGEEGGGDDHKHVLCCQSLRCL